MLTVRKVGYLATIYIFGNKEELVRVRLSDEANQGTSLTVSTRPFFSGLPGIQPPWPVASPHQRSAMRGEIPNSNFTVIYSGNEGAGGLRTTNPRKQPLRQPVKCAENPITEPSLCMSQGRPRKGQNTGLIMSTSLARVLIDELRTLHSLRSGF